MSTPVIIPELPNQSLPPRFRCGDTLTWQTQTTLPVGWYLIYILTQLTSTASPARIQIGTPGGVAIDASGVASFSIPGTTTTAWTPGKYEWIAFSLDPSGNRTQIASGQIRLLPDPNATTVADPRTHNEKVLEQLRALVEGKSLDDVNIYKIGGRELTKMPIMDLLKWQGIYEGRVRNERIRRGKYVRTQTVGVTFGGRGIQ